MLRESNNGANARMNKMRDGSLRGLAACSLWSETTHLDFWELHDLGKDLDAVGVGDHRVHAPAVGDGGWDGFQFVPTYINFFKFLQFCHFTKTRKSTAQGVIG